MPGVRQLVGAGVGKAKAAAGGEPPREYFYRVREPFKASFSCERERANQPCSPLSDLWLEFSAQLDRRSWREFASSPRKARRRPADDINDR